MVIFTLEDVNFNNILTYPSMEIQSTGTTFLSGESGSGKSTLLKLLNGVLSPTEGSIRYGGKTLETFDPIQLRREVLLVSQTVYLFDASIRDNFHTYYGYRELEKITDRAMNEYLDIAAISLPLDSMCSILSGGERQRVFLAINLSFGPKVLMLDEPTSALDDKNADLLMGNLITHCRERGITLLVVSHDRAIAEKYADHIITLEGGAAT